MSHRLFFFLHKNDAFIQAVAKKLQRKFNRVQEEKSNYVNAINLKKVSFGPHLPILSNIQILDLSAEGSITLASDLTYKGGFNMQIDIVFHPIKFIDKIVTTNLDVILDSLEGKFIIYCAAPPSNRVWIGFQGEPDIKLSMDTQLSSETRQFQISQVSNIIIYKLKKRIYKKNGPS